MARGVSLARQLILEARPTLARCKGFDKLTYLSL